MPTTIDSLPQEVIDAIAGHLPQWWNPEPDYHREMCPVLLPDYATISRTWQAAVERRTFERISLKSYHLSEFDRIMVGQRRRYLREISYSVVLPIHKDRACAKFETASDMAINNRVLTNHVEALLRLLNSWCNQQLHQIEHRLDLYWQGCYSPMDSIYRGLEQYKSDQTERDLGHRNDLFGTRYEDSFLQLLNLGCHVDVPQIRHFAVSRQYRVVESQSVIQIASRFLNLESLQLEIKDDARKAKSRQENRYSASNPLKIVWLCHELCLHHQTWRTLYHSYPVDVFEGSISTCILIPQRIKTTLHRVR